MDCDGLHKVAEPSGEATGTQAWVWGLECLRLRLNKLCVYWQVTPHLEPQGPLCEQGYPDSSIMSETGLAESLLLLGS